MEMNELAVILNDLLTEEETLLHAMATIGASVTADMEEGYDDDGETYWHFIEVNKFDYLTMGDPSFRLHFRMSRITFEALVQVVGNHLLHTGRLKEERTPVPYILMMVLWVLATPDSFRSIALRFGVRPATLHYHYLYMLEVFHELAARYITWPDAEERATISAAFEARTAYFGVIGAIDCTHIKITAPRYDAIRYINRHDTTSVNTQIVCDHRLLIRDIDVGQPGSKHDAIIFTDSALCHKLVEDPTVINFDEHLVGDGGYTLADFLMIPYRNTGLLTDVERIFNTTHAKARAPIENCNARLKMMWRRLLSLHSMHHDIVVMHVIASAMLHNFVILRGEEEVDAFVVQAENKEAENEDVEIEKDEDPALNQDAPFHQLLADAKERGIEKRLHIMRNIVEQVFNEDDED